MLPLVSEVQGIVGFKLRTQNDGNELQNTNATFCCEIYFY